MSGGLNLTAYVMGSLKALRGDPAWASYFNLTRTGFRQSFLALAFSVAGYYICALAVQTQRATLQGGEATSAIPLAVFIIILLLYGLSFLATAYIIAMVFDRQDRFRAWVIVRHWAIFFSVFLVACGFGLFLLGLLPFVIANGLAFIIYLASLFIDIRLAQKIVGFKWGEAVLVGCLIFAMALTVLMIGVAQFAV